MLGKELVHVAFNETGLAASHFSNNDDFEKVLLGFAARGQRLHGFGNHDGGWSCSTPGQRPRCRRRGGNATRGDLVMVVGEVFKKEYFNLKLK